MKLEVVSWELASTLKLTIQTVKKLNVRTIYTRVQNLHHVLRKDRHYIFKIWMPEGEV
jgi:hypothetical protein